MPSNIEMKARVENLGHFRKIVEHITTEPVRTLYQEDVFFVTEKGRLKLRILSDSEGELIYYERPDTDGPKQSYYQIYKTPKPEGLRQLLMAVFGELIVVKKKRDIYMVGQTRIHLDKVDALGTFMELEVVLKPDLTPEEGYSIAAELMKELNIKEADLIPCAYADLLLSMDR